MVDGHLPGRWHQAAGRRTEPVARDAQRRACAPGSLGVDKRIADHHRRRRGHVRLRDNGQEPGRIGLAAGGRVASDHLREERRQLEPLEDFA